MTYMYMHVLGESTCTCILYLEKLHVLGETVLGETTCTWRNYMYLLYLMSDQLSATMATELTDVQLTS